MGVTYTACMQALRNGVLVLLMAACAFGQKQQLVPAIRWTEGAANCTRQQGDDGRYYYALSWGDFEITLALDPKELEKRSS